MKNYSELLDQLKSGTIEKLSVTKEEFLEFRSVLIKRSDFLHFRGEAHHHGHVIYTYIEQPKN